MNKLIYLSLFISSLWQSPFCHSNEPLDFELIIGDTASKIFEDLPSQREILGTTLTLVRDYPPESPENSLVPSSSKEGALKHPPNLLVHAQPRMFVEVFVTTTKDPTLSGIVDPMATPNIGIGTTVVKGKNGVLKLVIILFWDRVAFDFFNETPDGLTISYIQYEDAPIGAAATLAGQLYGIAKWFLEHPIEDVKELAGPENPRRLAAQASFDFLTRLEQGSGKFKNLQSSITGLKAEYGKQIKGFGCGGGLVSDPNFD